MINPYRQLFAAPGSVAFAATGFSARMAQPMAGIGIITMLAELRGDFGLAGSVAAVFTASSALLGPQVSRLVDRHGQSRILLPAAGLSAASLGALLLCARYDAPAWTLFVFAALAGWMPNMAAMVRARWSEIYRGSPRLHAAFSFESVVDELTFVIGPALSIALSTAVFPAAGPLVAALLLAVGVLLFTRQRETEPVVRPSSERTSPSAIRLPALVALVLVLTAGGTIVGTVDVVSVAAAGAEGHSTSAGIVIAVYALGSAMAGLVFGGLRLNWPLTRLLLVGSIGTAVTTLPLLLVDSIAWLAVALFFAGLFFAPTMIVVMSLVERIVPAARLTEGMTWVITGLSLGVAVGAAGSGAAVDQGGPDAGFWVAIGAGSAMVLLVLVGYRVLQRADERGRPVSSPARAESGV
ncbi:MFS transporter [Kribbella sp. CA-293567]|uniref:MFS transporter n=1 Tax=Kribbella sp. CA-293567 TaxID=3002436 RepID=UPI0022DD248E|nr:MFS transporter [Kribbella sp. CA-293567]WBQ04433.1 MFS transporter [Kribbella sp. CA-293567]